MSFNSENITYNLNAEFPWEIGFDEIAGKLWSNEYSIAEKNIHLGQFSLATYSWSLSGFNGNTDNEFFEINDDGILHWSFEDGGYDFDYESINDWNQDNEYEIIANAWDESSNLVSQQHLKISIHDIDDTAAGISVINEELEELLTDENDYFRELEHNISYDWINNTKLISNYDADQEVKWTFDTESDERYFRISSLGVLKYRALPEFFTASKNNLDAISQITLNATNEQGLISQIDVNIQPDNFCPIRYKGNNSSENFSGKKGGDFLIGRGGNDKLKGNQGNDFLNGGSQKDKLYGGSGKDRLYGGSSSDRLYGGSSFDRLYGNSGKDFLKGDSGNDKLYGGSSKDTLIGGKGKDDLYGGSGRDIFKLTKGSGYDRIRDFKKGTDKIYIKGFKSLRIVDTGRHSRIYNGSKDLIAVIYNEDDIKESGNYLI